MQSCLLLDVHICTALQQRAALRMHAPIDTCFTAVSELLVETVRSIRSQYSLGKKKIEKRVSQTNSSLIKFISNSISLLWGTFWFLDKLLALINFT